ncbi:TRAP transporter substrate-binding protein [Sedimenticola selenatireducens]|uniref:C4-dicarboxylate ABC transporter n=1 Tax=Sedimenticola selenatireducens TaxID=191960 RepID=A0A558DP21_9GAMM|nr:TRAP transporter substrate-binding protein DctP [Sedimenticola selenatireducens]TVO78367.1 C4-dicarboxylate ABC transporter [Sedimenticola selenatireducens]TVT62775.1 MAG: C4-dicarboxylate ABC transporter [Sedimenticola selenatireducens]
MLKSLILCLSILLPALSVSATTLKIATLAPDGTSWMKIMREGATEVEQQTNGRVKIRFYPGGVMGNDNSVLRKIRVGQLHGGAITAGGLSSVYPDIQIYSLPFLFRSFEEVDYVRERVDPVLIKGLQENGFISYGISEGGFAYLMSHLPLDSVDALRQQKIWSPEGDQISLTAFRTIDVSPVPLPLTDVLTGLQTGLIDTVGSSPIGAIALQWHTRIKHIADIPLIYLYGTLVITEKAVSKLTPGDRQILKQVMEKQFQQINQQNRSDNLGARKALQEQGIIFHQPMNGDRQSWQELIDKVEQRLNQENQLDPVLFKQIQQHLETVRKVKG